MHTHIIAHVYKTYTFKQIGAFTRATPRPQFLAEGKEIAKTENKDEKLGEKNLK